METRVEVEIESSQHETGTLGSKTSFEKEAK